MGAMTPTRAAHRRQSVPARPVMSKVPQVTTVFWVVKILTTGMGETASDYLARALGPVPAVGSAALLPAVTLVAQARARRYVPAVYWAAVIMVSMAWLSADERRALRASG